MILDGKKLSEKIFSDIKNKVTKLGIKPVLAVVFVGDNEANKIYVNSKKIAAQKVGFGFELYNLKNDCREKDLLDLIKKLNDDSKISGFIVQLPLPKGINQQKIIDSIDPKKDVDGFSKKNIGKLFYNDNTGIQSCTPKGIKRLLDEYEISLVGKNVTIIGKSNIVGKPLSLLFINNAATVTVCDIHTKNISEHTLKSDIIVSAAGVPGLIKKEMVKDGSILIDVGITKVNGKIYGDCDFPNLEKNNYITPVPGGVGPMTVAMLIENIYLAHINKNPS